MSAIALTMVTWVACGSGESETTTTDSPTTMTSADTSTPAPAPAVPATVVEIAVGSPDYSTLLAAVTAAGLAETLSGDGPFTVFAPTNAAFAALPAGTLDNLLKPKNKAKLASILTFHVVACALKSTDLTDGMKAKTVNGEEVTINVMKASNREWCQSNHS